MFVNLYLFLADTPLYICTTSFLFIHLLMDTSYFHVLAVVNSAVMNIAVDVSFRIRVVVFPRFKHVLSRLNSNIFGSWTNSANRTHHPLPTHFSSLTPTCLTIPLVYLFRKFRKTRQIVCSGQVQDARSRSRLRNPRDQSPCKRSKG